VRVLHIGKYFPPHPGGIEYVLHDLLGAQRRLGIDAAAVVHQHTRSQPTVCEDFRSSPLWRVRTWGQLLYVPIAPTFPLALRSIVRRFNPDIIHSHVPNTSAFSVLLPGVLPAGIPGVVHWHSDVVPSQIDRRIAWAYRLYRPFERRLLAKTDAVIATSAPYLESSAALRPWKHKCHVVPLGIDPARLSEPNDELRNWAREQWRGRGLKVLAIGRLTYYKGHEVLLDALGRGADLTLCLVGEGERQWKLNDLVNRFGVTDRVNMLGFLSDDKVQALLAECDCLCLPSLERTEAFGVVLLEAMRYGKPLVASDIPGSGVGWVCQDNVTGLLAEPANPAALAHALERLQDDPSLAKRLGCTGAERFRAEFHIDRVAESTRRIYETLLA